jgi:hypothetical protein
MLTTTLHPPFQTTIDNQIDGKTVDPDRLLGDLLQSGQQLLQVAKDHGLSLRQLIVWIKQPGVQALLDEADAAAARIAEHMAAQARPGAVHSLTTQTMLIESVKDRETAAKACRAILRIPIRETEPNEAPLAPIGQLRIPKPPRPRVSASPRPPHKHPTNHRRPRDLLLTDPTVHQDSLTIPVYRFRPDSKPPIGPMSPIGPIRPIEPYEILDPGDPRDEPRPPSEPHTKQAINADSA